MPANIDDFTKEQEIHHPSFPQGTGKSNPKASGPEQTLKEGMRTMVALGRNRLGWTQEKLAEEVGVDVKTIQNAEKGRHCSHKKLREFCDLLEKELAKAKYPTLESLLHENRQHALYPSAPNFPKSGEDCSPRIPIFLPEDTLLDPLSGIVFAESYPAINSEIKRKQWVKAVDSRKQWLKQHPNDLFCRAMILWTVLNNGHPNEMLAILRETADFVENPISRNSASTQWGITLRSQVEKVIRGEGRDLGLIRRHVLDTLVRAGLLCKLRNQGRNNWLQKECSLFCCDWDGHYGKVMRSIFDTRETGVWLSSSLEFAITWAGHDRDSGLARLCWIWFAGQQRQSEAIRLAIEASLVWLLANPQFQIVRWAMIWLAGICEESLPILAVLNDSANWLDSNHNDDDTIVRHGFLWLVGAKGNSQQVSRAISKTEEWLHRHPEDYFIRVTFLLFLLARRGTIDDRKRVIAETNRWLATATCSDAKIITRLAMDLCGSSIRI